MAPRGFATRHHTKDLIEVIIKLRKEKRSIREIAERLGVDRSSVGYAIRKHWPEGKEINVRKIEKPNFL